MATTEEVKARLMFVSEVQNFLHTCQQDIKQYLCKLEWSPEHFLQPKELGVCPYDDGHIMPKESLDKHAPVCSLLKKGVPKSVVMSESMCSSQFFYEKADQIGKFDIDKETLNKVLWNHHVNNHSIFYGQSELPLTTNDAAAMLTPGERAAVYSYVVQRAKEENKMVGLERDNLLTTDFQEIVKKKGLEELNDKPKSYQEYLKAMRDYKRRRQSYRAKNVHITKKSYTEIIREVIENQTEYLTEIRKQDEEEESDQPHGQKDKAPDSEDDHASGPSYIERYITHEIRESKRESEKKSRARDRSGSRQRDGHRERKRHRSRDRSHGYRDDSETKDRAFRERSPSYKREKTSRIKEEDGHRSRSRDRSGSREGSMIYKGDSKRSGDVSSEEHSGSRERSRHKKSHKKHKHKHKHHKSHKS